MEELEVSQKGIADIFREYVMKAYLQRHFEDNRSLIFEVLVREVLLYPLWARFIKKEDPLIIEEETEQFRQRLLKLFENNRKMKYNSFIEITPLSNSFCNLKGQTIFKNYS